MQSIFLPFTGTVDNRSPRDGGDTQNDVWLRENFTVRDGVTKSVRGTEKLSGEPAPDPITWLGRYYSNETGVVSPKSFAYSQNGSLYYYTDLEGGLSPVETDMATGAYPRHWNYKLNTQTIQYLVDGTNLWSYDGNNSMEWNKETLEDIDGNSVTPIDVIEHKDRLCVLSPYKCFISANLQPTNFTDATDSLETVVGSGKGYNLAFGKIKDTETLYILNTEGIFAIIGDTISAVASTFEVRLVDEGKCAARGSVVDVERAIVYLGVMGERYELMAFDGVKSEVLTYKEKLHEKINPYKDMMDKMVATYDDNYYKLSFVESGGKTYPELEIWWDALEKKCTYVRGRNVGSYMLVDITQEMPIEQFGRSDNGYVMWGGRGRNFDGSPIALKWRTKDIKFSEDKNVRIDAFRPKITPSGDKDITIRYYLDGRLSTPTTRTDGIFSNTDFENFTATLPTGWNLSGGTSAQETTIVYNGNSSVKLTGGLVGGSVLTQQIRTSLYVGQMAYFSCYVWCDTASEARIVISDASTTSSSAFHTGSSSWERLEVSKLLTGDATSPAFTLYCSVKSNTQVAYFDACYAYAETVEVANWTQNLEGENITLGLINIANQTAVTDRIKPQIKFSRGKSITFDIDMTVSEMGAGEVGLEGIGIDLITKPSRKGKKVGA